MEHKQADLINVAEALHEKGSSISDEITRDTKQEVPGNPHLQDPRHQGKTTAQKRLPQLMTNLHGSRR